MPYTASELIEKIIEMSELVGSNKVALQIEVARLKKARESRKPTDEVPIYEDFAVKSLEGALKLAQESLEDYKKDLISITRR